MNKIKGDPWAAPRMPPIEDVNSTDTLLLGALIVALFALIMFAAGAIFWTAYHH